MDPVPDSRGRSAGHRGDHPTLAILRPEHAARLAPQLARAVLIVVLIGFYALAFLHVWYLTKNVVQVGLSAVYMIGLLWLQTTYFSRPNYTPRPPLSYLALFAQACLVYLPMFQFGDAWISLPGLLAGSVLLTLPPRAAWVLFGLIVTSMTIAEAILTGGELISVAYTTISTTITGLIVWGLTRLGSLVNQLHQARSELAQMAVTQERLRFARDLHDLLGYSLSAITLKSELTHRLVIKQPERAQEELSEVLDISRRALADVRTVASGYRELSLDAEARSVRSVLLAADVEVHMDMDYDHIPVLISTMLATVLREGVTNMLRHSKAEWCEITVRRDRDQVQMDIVNDGVPETPVDSSRNGGSGIQNLSTRVAALGGRLSAGPDRDGRFRLHVSAPVPRHG